MCIHFTMFKVDKHIDFLKCVSFHFFLAKTLKILSTSFFFWNVESVILIHCHLAMWYETTTYYSYLSKVSWWLWFKGWPFDTYQSCRNIYIHSHTYMYIHTHTHTGNTENVSPFSKFLGRVVRCLQVWTFSAVTFPWLTIGKAI